MHFLQAVAMRFNSRLCRQNETNLNGPRFQTIYFLMTDGVMCMYVAGQLGLSFCVSRLLFMYLDKKRIGKIHFLLIKP